MEDWNLTDRYKIHVFAPMRHYQKGTIMKYFGKLLCMLCLCLAVLTGCRAYILTEQLPSLVSQSTQMPEILSIEVVRLSDNASVTLREPDRLTEMMNHITGIQCIRERQTLAVFAEENPPQYEIIFHTAKETTELYVSGTTEFYLNNYYYSSLYGGIDSFYLGYLFTEQGETGEVPQ